MKNTPIITICSYLLNLIFVIILIKNLSANDSKQSVQRMSPKTDLSINNNFQKIFIEKDDTLYRAVFNKSFEDLPTQCYMLACAYYLLKRDSNTLNDVKMITSEIKGIYGRAPEIQLCK